MTRRARREAEASLFDLASDPGTPAPPSGGNGGGPVGPGGIGSVPLHEAAQTRYLTYALSVITSRALPDVRDGLKPVQRRILFTMWQQNLTADAKHRKCAKVVGDVMGGFHPHGDASIYETLVRLAQPFALRYPLIDGSGNFGSLDGDAAAAMRYTECRLARISDEVLGEIDQETVAFRPNYDGTKTEPVVLPARLPNLSINGATGIAVGMATNVPPHNLGEVCTALREAARQSRAHDRPALSLRQGPRLPHRRPDPEHRRGTARDLSHRRRRRPPARHLGDGRDASHLEDGRDHERALCREQGGARRAHRRGRAQPQAAAAARRARRLHRRRPHRARDQARGRREDGDGVSLQAHAAPDQLQRQPHLPHPDRESRGRTTRASRPEGDALALPPLPAGGRDASGSSTSSRRWPAASTSSKASRRSSTPSTRSSS